MHIAEGVLSPPVLVSGGVVTIVGLAIGLRQLDPQRVPRTGVLSAALFVASLIQVPVGGASVHLVLSGLAGLLLGWAVFPAIFVALLLQAVLFQFGGLTTLGVNTAILACPALLSHLLLARAVARGGRAGFAAGFIGGAVPIGLSGVLVASALWLTGDAFANVAVVLLAAHVPIMVIEGFIATFCIGFLRAVRPNLVRPDAHALEVGNAS
jgi:cobalt/nickel transport system permease protein